MATRNVVLTAHQEQLIASLIEAGHYQNASEVLRDGLRVLEREQREFEARLGALRAAAQRGWDDVEGGRYTDVTSQDDHDVLWGEIDRRLESRGTSKAPKAG